MGIASGFMVQFNEPCGCYGILKLHALMASAAETNQRHRVQRQTVD